MSTALAAGTEVLYREAYFLDTQRWDEWLALFVEDCEYWVPAWKGDHEPTSDPRQELSLIYYSDRAGLEDRVWRARSGRSVASKPLPRTQHLIANVLLDGAAGADAIRLLSNWTVHQFRLKSREIEVLFGRAEHELVRRDGAWRVRRKKVILLNDSLPAALDFYSL